MLWPAQLKTEMKIPSSSTTITKLPRNKKDLKTKNRKENDKN